MRRLGLARDARGGMLKRRRAACIPVLPPRNLIPRPVIDTENAWMCGCGFGALVIRVAQRYGAEAGDGGARRAGPRPRGTASVELADYRDLRGPFGKIAPVGMVEHVGVHRLFRYFATIYTAMAPEGLFLNHGITRPENLRLHYARTCRMWWNACRHKTGLPEHRGRSSLSDPGAISGAVGAEFRGWPERSASSPAREEIEPYRRALDAGIPSRLKMPPRASGCIWLHRVVR